MSAFSVFALGFLTGAVVTVLTLLGWAISERFDEDNTTLHNHPIDKIEPGRTDRDWPPTDRDEYGAPSA